MSDLSIQNHVGMSIESLLACGGREQERRNTKLLRVVYFLKTLVRNVGICRLPGLAVWGQAK